MTAAMKDFLQVLKYAVQKKEVIQDLESDLGSLLQMAQKQQMALVIFPALVELYNAGRLAVSPEEFAMLEQEYMVMLSKELRRRYAIHATVSELEENGFACCMLKGIVLAELYPVPEARISGDADFYIDPTKEKAICDFLKGRGFAVKERPKTSHHAMCKSEATGMIEFHLSLYDALFEDVWFNHPKLAEPYREYITAEGHTYTTLGTTDHAVFITLHLIKHFLSMGVGVRQLMDVLLYLRRYEKEMDVKHYASIFVKLGYDKFLQTCFYIGEKYLGFLPEEFSLILKELPSYEANDKIADVLLQDMEQGGVFGHDDASRQAFFLQYTKARFERFKHESYDVYINAWAHVSLWKRMFPSYQVMARDYPILKKKKILLPLYYAIRLVKKVFMRSIGKEKDYDYAQTGIPHERMELIKELDMV
ncbi:MAG: nucleotidyltransferase family protein [Clostridia bacterium]|nr:nucleotidyltransferase family protein [Clostridia bacterium]